MGGYVRVDDISRSRIVALHSLRGEGDPDALEIERNQLEVHVVTELLRSTPRFWNVVTARISVVDDGTRGSYQFRITSLEGFPAYATPTFRLRVAVAQLRDRMETLGGMGWTHALVVAAWTSPKTWAYDAEYRYVAQNPREWTRL